MAQDDGKSPQERDAALGAQLIANDLWLNWNILLAENWAKGDGAGLLDGSARLVIAHADPGLANWMPTLGHRLGTMCFRFISAPKPVSPVARLARRTASGWSIL